MVYALLLMAGVIVSVAHVYLVFKNKNGKRYSISEHAIADKKSHAIYISSHLATDVLFLLYAYVFFYQSLDQNLLFGLTVVFITLDALQAFLPSKDKTESLHFAFAYASWFIYQLVGILSLLWLDIAAPYKTISVIFLLPVLVMFVYMHFKREKLWPYQLIMVPLYVLFLLFLTMGATN